MKVLHQRARARTGTVLATVVALALIPIGCGRSGTASDSAASPGSTAASAGVIVSDDKPVVGGKIVYGLSAETNGWNLASNQFSGAGLLVARTIFDPMAAFADDLSVRPFLAEKIEHDADFRIWTITLRSGVTFHNGGAVTAVAVKRNQEHLRKSPVYGKAYELVDSFTVDGDLRLIVHLKERWVSFPSVLTGQIGMVAEPDWLESNDSVHPIGTGPFTFDSWQPGAKLAVKKNANYWQADGHGNRYPYLDAIDFSIITDGTARSAALRSGSVDAIQGVGPAELRAFREQGSEGEYQVFTDEKADTAESFIQLNTAVPPFDDIDARRALAYATDAAAYAEVIEHGMWEPAAGPFGKGSKYHGETGYPAFDPAEAKALVDEVKARHGGEFSFTVYGTPETGTPLQFLQQQWASVGMDVKIELMEQAKMIIQVAFGKYEATIWSGFDSPDPVIDSVFLQPENVRPLPEISLMLARWADTEMGDALKDARRSDDPAKVVADYQKVAQRLGEGVPFVWLSHGQAVVISTPKLVNIVRVHLPDGSMGLPIQSGAHALYQLWIRP